MNRIQDLCVRVRLALAIALVLAFGCGPHAVDDTAPDDDRQAEAELAAVPAHPDKALCAATGPGQMRCHARVRTDEQGAIESFTTAHGLTPKELASAYKIPTDGGQGETVALVAAQDDPDAEKNLAVYRKHFGLGPCTSQSGCFTKVDQRGGTDFPSPDAGWAGEMSLDLDMASAGCPKCRLLLVEADSADPQDLGAAVETAVSMGASVVSCSWGAPEDASVKSLEKFFDQQGVAIFVSAGDAGYGVEYPAASAHVTAVGGTRLVKSSSKSRGWVEAAWGTAQNSDGGTGSGCSKYIAKPKWQTDKKCRKRTVADVAAVADPDTGVAVYDTYQSGGWGVYGGTSAASPLVAAIYAATGNAAAAPSLSYDSKEAFFDVKKGTNGSCGSYLCKARAGYDGPTGNGTPDGDVLTGLN